MLVMEAELGVTTGHFAASLALRSTFETLSCQIAQPCSDS